MKKQREAEKSAADVQSQYDELIKRQKMNDPDVMEFKVYFRQVQEVQGKLIMLLENIRGKDPETAKGLIEALHKLGEKYSAV